MAPSTWTHSGRALRDTPVVDYSVQGLNTTRCAAYRPPIAVSLSLLARSRIDFERTLWCCCQLRQYIGMGALGTRLHRDCNATGDVAKISPRVPSTCTQNSIIFLLIIHIIPSRQIYVTIENPRLVLSVCSRTTSSYLRNPVLAADDDSHIANLQRNSCRCFSHLNSYRDGTQVA